MGRGFLRSHCCGTVDNRGHEAMDKFHTRVWISGARGGGAHPAVLHAPPPTCLGLDALVCCVCKPSKQVSPVTITGLPDNDSRSDDVGGKEGPGRRALPSVGACNRQRQRLGNKLSVSCRCVLPATKRFRRTCIAAAVAQACAPR